MGTWQGLACLALRASGCSNHLTREVAQPLLEQQQLVAVAAVRAARQAGGERPACPVKPVDVDHLVATIERFLPPAT